MSHLQSPCRMFSGDVPGSLGVIPPPKDELCAPSLPLSSPFPTRPSGIASPMATTFSDSAPPPGPHLHAGLADVDDGSSLQWPTHPHGNLSLTHLDDGISYHVSPQYAPDSSALFGYIPGDLSGLQYEDNYNLTYSALNPSPSCPRSYATGLDLSTPMGAISEFHPPSAYVIDPPRQQEIQESADPSVSSRILQMQPDNDFNTHYASSTKVGESAGYAKFNESETGTRCSTPFDNDRPTHAHDLKFECTGDDGGIDRELPYAQLIYRALMEAPKHTMILRDIYDWFKAHTDKAADKEGTGWKNSIRHNLSMNGAFEKVDQPNEDSKKGFMWRLTNEAIRDGVKSTTRYRSKQPNKRGHRTQHPQPQRQASGAKGGQAARRSAKARRTQRMNDPYSARMARSVPISSSCGYDSPGDMSMSSHSSPYYSSEIEFSHPACHDDFGSPYGSSNGDMLSCRSFSTSPQIDMYSDSAFHMGPTEPMESLFYEATSPSTSGPLTPATPNDFDMGAAFPAGAHYVFDDVTLNYREC